MRVESLRIPSLLRVPLLALLGSSLLAGCTVNPVTGSRDFITQSPAQDLAIGQQNYVPMQQSQGGVYDVDPELTAYVDRVGQRLAAVSDNPLPYEFVVLNNSVPNAWALPGGKIAINRGLLTELNSEAELAAVLGHEIVHAAARHTAQQISRASLLQGVVLATAVAAANSDYGELAVGGALVGTQLINTRYGREAELESDEYGMRYMSQAGYDPQGAVTLQETFVRLSEGRRQDWLSGLFASHPPSQARVEANVRTAAELPAGGILGVEAYETALKKTRDALPAYEAYDEARAALADDKPKEAMALVGKAIELFPEEAHFYALRGDLRMLDDEHNKAVTNYNSAIRRRDNFFYYYLQRGLAKRESGSIDAAVADLEQSLSLLETAPAHYALGEIAEQRGDRATAMAHYRVVAQSQGGYGQAAAARFTGLDLPTNPGKYLLKRCAADGAGELIVSVKNDTELRVADIELVVAYSDGAGQARQLRRTIGGPLGPGEVASVATGLGPYTGPGCPVTIVGARVLR